MAVTKKPVATAIVNRPRPIRRGGGPRSYQYETRKRYLGVRVIRLSQSDHVRGDFDLSLANLVDNAGTKFVPRQS